MFTCPIGFFNFIVSSGGGGTTDPYAADVVLFLKGDGTNGSTAITDSSPSPKTISVFGNAQISTAQSKYGGSSLLFDGSGDYLTAPNNESFNFTSRILTIEFWCYIQAASTPNAAGNRNASPLNTYPNSSSVTGWAFYIGGNTTQTGVQLFIESNSSIFKTVIVSVPNQQQNHLGFCQNGDNGYFFLNGTVYPVDCTGFTLGSTSNPLKIGGMNYIGYEHFLNGYLDSVRITKNVCRYTSNFNPETDTYLNSSSAVADSLLIHLNPSSYPGSGTTWTDLRGNFNFSLVGGVSFSNGEMVFNGNSGYAQTVSNPSIPSGSSPISLEIYARSTFNRPFVVSKTSPSSETLNFNFSNNQLGLTSTNSGNTDFSVSVSNISNTYYHLVATYDGSFVRLYRNGILVGTSTSGRLLGGNSAPLRLMCFDPSNSPYAWFVNGAIKVFRLYTKALSDAEVLQNYNSIL